MNFDDFGGHFIQVDQMLTKCDTNNREDFFLTFRDSDAINYPPNRRSVYFFHLYIHIYIYSYFLDIIRK